ncbi:MAG: DNA gyrase inhibitor YacG [Burkholderiales bacterium]
MVRAVSCPSCSASVTWEANSKFRPFCSERCRLIDLGAWATEKYRVAKPHNDADEDSAQDFSDNNERPSG